MGGAGGTGGGGGQPSCYSETVDLGANINDLQQAFSGGNWLDTSLGVLTRRYPFGQAILQAERNDPQLPGFVDSSSFPALMEALMTMCHEETHGWDYESASGGNFSYHMGTGLEIRPPQTDTFPRSEISTYITDNITQAYDDTYLSGEQGSYGFVEMNDELNAYTNGLGCIAAVGDKLTSAISARDGMSAHLLYLEYYLRRARTAHPNVYTALKGASDWQRFVRYAWARGHFWHEINAGDANLVIADAPIWTRVHQAENVAEIQMFTDRDPTSVACNP
jgi:hypothetical protein